MAQDPKQPVDSKVGAYDKPERNTTGPIIGIIVAVIAVLLILWLFTDII